LTEEGQLRVAEPVLGSRLAGRDGRIDGPEARHEKRKDFAGPGRIACSRGTAKVLVKDALEFWRGNKALQRKQPEAGALGQIVDIDGVSDAGVGVTLRNNAVAS
jgi:hypothetical protein